MVSKVKLQGHVSFPAVKGWVLSVVLGVYSWRFVVGTDFSLVPVLVLLRVMLSPGRRRGDFRKGKTLKGGSFLKQSLPFAQKQCRLFEYDTCSGMYPPSETGLYKPPC